MRIGITATKRQVECLLPANRHGLTRPALTTADFPTSEEYKKFTLMLTRRAKAYSSPVRKLSVSPTMSSPFILEMCAAAEDRKNQ